jgi:hypothetical protein
LKRTIEREKIDLKNLWSDYTDQNFVKRDNKKRTVRPWEEIAFGTQILTREFLGEKENGRFVIINFTDNIFSFGYSDGIN